ncbi:hypothetical protein ON010_g5849 [Phytophthora cinnamomi]|nr:hypothetical protein ON010_g5849 [Phytophthora cinnamomi]
MLREYQCFQCSINTCAAGLAPVFHHGADHCGAAPQGTPQATPTALIAPTQASVSPKSRQRESEKAAGSRCIQASEGDEEAIVNVARLSILRRMSDRRD